MLKCHPVLWYVVITVALSFATYFLPLPVEQRSLLVPVLMVFIPTLVSVPMALVTEGREGIRQRLSTASLRRGGVKWLLIGAGIGALVRVIAWVITILFRMPIKADLSNPSAWFILLITIPLGCSKRSGGAVTPSTVS
jgi:hypothetical protein